MTLADTGLLEEVVMGCVVDLPTSGRRWHKDVQRAEGNGSGSPVGGTEVILATVSGDVTRYVDRGAQEPLDASKTYIYRYRLNRVGAQAGTWSDWSAEQKPTDLTGQLALPESAPPAAVVLSLDESTGQVRMRVGTSLGVQSLRYSTSTSDYPTTDTTHGSGTVVDTDASGDADVDPVATLAREETLYVTVLLYRQLSGSGSYVAIARQSIKYGVSEGRDPADQSAVNLLGEDAREIKDAPSGSGNQLGETWDDVTIDGTRLIPGESIISYGFMARITDSGLSDALCTVKVTFFDATDTVISSTEPSGGEASSYTREVHQAITVPANTSYMRFQVVKRGSDTTGGKAKELMLNRGPVAAPYSEPPIRKWRETLEDLFRDVLGGATGAQVLQRIRDDGHLGQGTQIDLGGVLFHLTRGRQDGSAPDDDGGTNNATVTFPTAYPDTPKVTVFGSGGLGYHATLGSSATQYRVMKPDTLDNQGFEMIGVLQDRSAISVQTDTFPAGTLTAQGDALSLAGQTEGQNGGSGLTNDAVDDSYTTEWNADLSITDGGSSGTFTNSTLSVTVAVDKWDSNDGVWQEADTHVYVLSASEGGSDSIDRNDVAEFTDSGVIGGDDVRVRIKDITENCGSAGCSSSVTVDPVETTYNVASVSEESMSPNAEKLSWAARMEVS